MLNDNFRKGLRCFLVVVGLTHLQAIDLPAQGKTYKLFLAPKKQDVLKYDYQFDLKRIREAAGQKSDVYRNVSAVIEYTVDDVDPQGNLWVSLMFEALKMGSPNPQGVQFVPTDKSLGIPVRYPLNPLPRLRALRRTRSRRLIGSRRKSRETAWIA